MAHSPEPRPRGPFERFVSWWRGDTKRTRLGPRPRRKKRDATREDFAQETLVGIDTETRPAFRKGESYPPSLVQVATAKAVYLFQIQQLDCSAILRELLSHERTVKAGVSLAYDLRQLKHVFAFVEKSVVDVGWAAKRRQVEQTGVRNLAAMFLGLRIPKGAKTTNWSARRLTPQQITYAATDAWVCRQLYLRFEELGIL